MKEVHLCMFFKKLHGGKNVITKNNVLIVYMAESEFNLLDRKAKQLKTTKSEVARTATQNYIHNVNLSNEKLLQIPVSYTHLIACFFCKLWYLCELWCDY